MTVSIPPSRSQLSALALVITASGAACGDSESPRPIETAPAPSTPAAGLDDERPDPCRGVPLPPDQHYVATGTCASAVAFDEEGLRQITFTPNGDLLGVRTSGQIMRFRDVNADGMFLGVGEIVEIANTGGNGNNADLDEVNGYLYAGSPDGVVRFVYAAGSDTLGSPEPVVVGQPSDGTHTYHTVHVYDGWLYVHSGSENNVVAPASPEYDTNRSLLKRFDLNELVPGAPFAWTAGEVFALGLRNMVGYAQSPAGTLYGVVNGVDELEYGGEDIHLDNPGEQLVELVQGQAYGYPFCFTAQNVAVEGAPMQPGTQLATETEGFDNPHDDAWCRASSTPPVTFLPAHTAPLDIAFFGSSADAAQALPEEWRDGAFVSLHGSWNTMPSVGHGVVHVPFGDAQPTMPESAATPPAFPFSVVLSGGSSAGPVDGTWGWSSGEYAEETVRPVGVAVSPLDGALYISSDSGGVLYRVGVPL